MVHERLFREFGLAVAVSVFCVAGVAQTSNSLAAIQAKVNLQFKLTKVTADRTDIVTAGDVVQLHKPGLVMYAVSSPLPPSNSYKNGKIGQGMGGFGKDLMIGMVTPGSGTAANYPHRQFVAEEKCWVTGIQVQKDGIIFQLYSDPYDDTRYYANLKIPFPDKKTVPPVDTATQSVAEVLTVVSAEDQSAPPPPSESAQGQMQITQPLIAGQYSAPSGSRILLLADGTFTKFVGNGQGHGQYVVNAASVTLTFTATGFSQQFKIQGGNLVDVNTLQTWSRTGDAPVAIPQTDASSGPSTPMPEIVPPPPPVDAPPPTIAAGQTKEQVIAAFGQPVKAAKIGSKDIFYYKDMKVTFLNGKVSNVE